ncbi:OmpA family protein [Arenibacter certesii]|uniref:OmpA-like domain-containing protein n=1 Tax=Arenibacter certesii TaxID=228955 RepID=A0A918J031_9FLAO|nr:OmpA family protein [Arenibacter certesii]GGW38840.1 hypothetical protein GCM10007383_24510 [Arenibacter certesii]
MEKVIALVFLFVTTAFHGQNENVGNAIRDEVRPLTATMSLNSEQKLSIDPKSSEDGMEAAFKANKINIKRFDDIFVHSPGYYLISNIYRSDLYLAKNLNKLRKKGFDAGFLFNPEDQLSYLYLSRFNTWQEALEASKTKLNQAYNEDIWVMIVSKLANESETKSLVTSNYETEITAAEEKMPVEEVDYGMLNSISNAQNTTTSVLPIGKNSWLNKANDYFNKMRYAEAASLYERALKKNPDAYGVDILQNAGDAHYFNTNMERAYFWYNKLYDKYKADVQPDFLFKYAHTLKGSGKYGRAKRMMRLYNKSLRDKTGTDKEGNHIFTTDANEVVLDEILTSAPNAQLKNLSINSTYSEFSPMFYKEDEIVFSSSRDTSFFNTRRYGWNNQPYLDLYVAKINEESQDVKDAIKFSNKINTKYHEAAVTFSADNATMYFTRNNYGKKLRRDKNGMNHLKIFVSSKVEGEWTEAKELPFNSDAYSTGHPALSPDGKKLYFVSDMPGSMGETDIFVVDVLGDGLYSEPKNLGPKINTVRKEMFPFVTHNKLYFSSDGRMGLGGLDVYEAELEEEGGFLEAVNVGVPINSEKDDFSYIVNENTNKGYFASNRKDGKGDDDLYSFERLTLEETAPNAISGTVVEHISGDVIPSALITLLDENNIKLKEMVAKEDGSFVFEDLDSNTKYVVKITKEEFFETELLAQTKKNEVVNTDVTMKRLKELIVLEEGVRKLKTDLIFFDFDKFNISREAANELDKLVAVMTKYKEMVIKIESHTDSRGPAVYNKYLSDRRAKSSRSYLISKGISEERIESAIGYGEERLINKCDDGVRCSSQQHELNRRSEFIIVKM